MPRCIHTVLTPLGDPGEFYWSEGATFEVCYSDDGYLVLAYEGHDGGGIVFGPEDAERLRFVLNHKPDPA